MENIKVEVFLRDENKRNTIGIDDLIAYEVAKIDIYKHHKETVKALCTLIRSQLVKRVKGLKYFQPNIQELVIDKALFNNLEEDWKKFIYECINETDGLITVVGDRTVDLYYTNCCGGGTANPEDIIGYRISYLRKVLCKHCMQNYFVKNINLNDYIKEGQYREFKEEIGNVFKNVERDEGGRILKIEFLNQKLSGQEFMDLLNIKGNKVYFSENSVLMKVIGDGLGLGLCLEGSDNVAKSGCGFQEIIKYYYTGIEFEKINEFEYIGTLRNKKIVIDPGHGGSDNGVITGTLIEKDINLNIALYLKEILEKAGAATILTRSGDKDVPLSERVEMINKERPEFYVSIHQNSIMALGVNGVEIYYYNNDKESMNLGNLIMEEINRNLGLKNRGVRSSEFYILRESRACGLVIECMYMTGESDRSKYTEECYKSLADSIFRGIYSYYNKQL